MEQLNLEPEKKSLLNEKQKRFLKKNIIYLITGGVLGLALLIFIATAMLPDEPGSAAGTPGETGQNEQNFTYLPDLTRTIDADKEPSATYPAQQPRDPFAGGMTLKGIITGGAGDDLAVIEAGNTAYILGTGATVAGEWTIEKINPDSVVITARDQELTLEFDGRAKHTSTAPAEAETETGDGDDSAEEEEVTPDD